MKTIQKKTVISSLVFCLLFGFAPKTEAVSTKVKTIGGGAAAIALAVGAVICYKQNAKHGKMIDKLSDIDLNSKGDEKLKELETAKWWYNFGLWTCSVGAIASGALATHSAWKWSKEKAFAEGQIAVGESIPLANGLLNIRRNEDNSYTVRTIGNLRELHTITPEQIEAGRENVSHIPEGIRNIVSIGSTNVEAAIDEMKQWTRTVRTAIEKVNRNEPLNQREEIVIGTMGSIPVGVAGFAPILGLLAQIFNQ